MNKKKCLDLKFMTRLGEQNSIFEFKLILIYQLMPGICSNHPILLNNTYTQYFTRFWIAIKFSNGILFEHWFTRCSHLMCTVHWFVFVMILQSSSKLTHIHTHIHISVMTTKTFVFSKFSWWHSRLRLRSIFVRPFVVVVCLVLNLCTPKMLFNMMWFAGLLHITLYFTVCCVYLLLLLFIFHNK